MPKHVEGLPHVFVSFYLITVQLLVYLRRLIVLFVRLLLLATIRRWRRESVVNCSFITNYVPWKCHKRNVGFSYRYWVRFTDLYLI